MTTTTAPARLWTTITTSALLLGLVHALVDLSCAFLIFRDVAHLGLDRASVVWLVILYNVIAFAGQAPAGALADRLRSYPPMAALGTVLAGAALFIGSASIVVSIVVIGIGNAFFHVGAGAQVLRTSGDRSTESGVFVGPGAMGLFMGAWLGGHDVPCRWVIVALLLLSVPLILRVARSTLKTDPLPAPRLGSNVVAVAVLCAALLLGSVTVRALVGGTVAGAWRGVSLTVMLGLALAACAGKMVGGFLSDRLGWATTSVAALLVSAPLVTYLIIDPAAAIIGMLIFQMTMPVTLKAMHHLMPRRPGLAFGLPCVALIAGSLPGLSGVRLFDVISSRIDISQLGSWAFAALSVGLSAALIVLGLRLLIRVGAVGGPGSELIARLLPATMPVTERDRRS